MGKTQVFVLSVLIIGGVNGVLLRQESVAKIFEDFEIVPDAMPTAPDDLILVTYPNGIKVNLGQELTPSQVVDTPNVTWNTERDQLYTLVNIDLDVPSREDPSSRSIMHWLVGNIQGTDIESGQTIAEYQGSRARLGSGLHRYIFLVYKQEGLNEYDEDFDSGIRRDFSMTDFAVKYNLGNPLAGNFYEAQWDESVGYPE